MQVFEKQLGPVDVVVSLEAGELIIAEKYPLAAGIDAALVSLEAKYPQLAPEIEMVKLAVDAQLAKP